MKPQISARELWDKKHELQLRCYCGGDHFVSFYAIADEEVQYIGLNVVDEYRPNNFWGFLCAAWRLFRDGSYHRGEVELTREDLSRILEWIQAVDADTEGSSLDPEWNKY